MQLAVSLIVVRFLLGFGLRNSAAAEEQSPTVTTPLGTVKGYYKTTNNGRKYEAYEGIPYALPPTGNLRFEVAKEIPSWNGIRMAKEYSPTCMQYSVLATDPALVVEGSEDCLYLNIYNGVGNDSRVTVDGTSTNLLPVIFYIHGGAYRWGSASMQGPDFLLDKDIVLVTFNYRLGPLGFLSTEDEIVPGNIGLKDQVLALRWVSDNIESFGGDPSKITLFGQSAGGSSVHFHYLTNLTAGLFQRGMSISGTAVNSWSITENSLETAKQLATIVGCSNDCVESMVECLKERPAHQIVRAVGKLTPWFNTPAVPFAPVVEKGASNFTFIDRLPYDIITSGDAQDLPWITSVVSEEGLAIAALFADLVINETKLQVLNDNWETIAPSMLDYNSTVEEADKDTVSALIKKQYLGSNEIDSSTLNETVQMIGDRLFVYDAVVAAKLQAEYNESPVFFYYFTYRGTTSFTVPLTGSTEDFGVAHMDDLGYVFSILGLNMTSTTEDQAMQDVLIGLWTSYATNNTPDVGVEWCPLDPSISGINYLHIAGPDDIAMESSDDFGQINFWKSINFEENENAECI